MCACPEILEAVSGPHSSSSKSGELLVKKLQVRTEL
jgi:hypothetical protein